MSDAGTFVSVFLADGSELSVQPRHHEEIERAALAYVVHGVDAWLVVHAVAGQRIGIAARWVVALYLDTPTTRDAQRAHDRTLCAEAKATGWTPDAE